MISSLHISKQRFETVEKIHVGETDDDFVKNRTSVKITGTDEYGQRISEVLKVDLDGENYIQTNYVWCLDCDVFKTGEQKPLLDRTSDAGVIFKPLVLDGEHEDHRGFGVVDVTRGPPNLRDRARCLRALFRNGEIDEQQ